MTRLLESLERAQNDAEQEHHLRIALDNLLSQIKDERIDGVETVEDRLGDPSAAPVFKAVHSYAYWRLSTDDAYEEGAKPAIQQFPVAFENARENEWNSIATLCLSELITLYGELNHDDNLEQWLEKSISFLESEYTSRNVNLGDVGRLFDTLQAHRYAGTEATLERAIDYLNERIDHAKQREDYSNERELLEELIELKSHLGLDITAEQKAIADSFEAEAEQKGRRSNMVRASVLSNAIERCEEFVDDQRVARWKREVREANRTAIEEEMQEITHEPSDEELEELEEGVESMVETYEQWVNKRDPCSAFKLALSQEVFIPDLETSRDIAEGSMISEIVTRSTISPEGDTVAVRNPREEFDTQPANYSAMEQHTSAILGSVLFRLVTRDILREHHFYRLIEDAHWLTAHDQAFLTDFVIAFFSHRYAEALHIGVARLEGVIARTLEHNGVPVTNVENEESEQRALGGLIREMSGVVDENFLAYLNYRYVDPAGMNLRNRISHGQLRYGMANVHHTSICLFDIFRSIQRIETFYE
ncbi:MULTISPECIES: DUF4209 domain-containing protein [Halolamina]|uniref:DUF4209 domain-containing protein n=1 Tax=Halolamina pelagica TaxID=699431 RepID=A0A1I5TDF1_9EURY|nr:MULTISPECIES: DUF4209 domain-containing protein [Halolamina]NHX37271.1 DUF4209 domain-containing protein [Halolamina sp. R1-12]SFP80727.1 protein of unknown function [Halolamina pelagica]